MKKSDEDVIEQDINEKKFSIKDLEDIREFIIKEANIMFHGSTDAAMISNTVRGIISKYLERD